MKGRNRKFLNFLGVDSDSGRRDLAERWANTTECLRFLQWPIIIIGITIMVISLLGFVGACYRQTWLLQLYLVVMFVVLAALSGFIVFAFAVTDRGHGQVVVNRAFLEYQISDYSGWLKDRVSDHKYWSKISSLLRDSHVCSGMHRDVRDTTTGAIFPEPADMFYQRQLSPIQVLSNGIYRSVEHQVIERLSMAFFYNPRSDLLLGPMPELVSRDRPAMYQPMTFDQYRLYIRKQGPRGKSHVESLKAI